MTFLAPLPAGAVLQQRYRVGRAIGHGGMGAVYEAIDQNLNARVALKQILRAPLRHPLGRNLAQHPLVERLVLRGRHLLKLRHRITDDLQRVDKAQPVGVHIHAQGSLVHAHAHRIVGQQQARSSQISVQPGTKAEASNNIRRDALGISDSLVDGEVAGEIGLVDATKHA